MQSSPGSEERTEVAPEPEAAADSGPGVEQRLAEAEDRHKRALADLDNYRKSSLRDNEQRIEESRATLLRDWLEAVDSVERALRMEEPGTPLFDGLRAVLDQMESILGRNGVERIAAAGRPFDPERHEAVAVRDTDDVPDRTVLDVARSGFTRGDAVLRPAQVLVSRGRQA
jgi:molecular chaperone GrpE